MLRGNKNTRPGLAILEVIIVLAISGALFVVVLGTFNTRKRVQADDSARQVMSEIARVRNDAQQGLGANTTTVPAGLVNKEIFGVAIQFNDTRMRVFKLAQSRTPPLYLISVYESYEIAMPYQFRWDNTASYIGGYGSSYNGTHLSTIPAPSGTLVTIVFRNGTGQSYAFRAALIDTFKSTAAISKIANYTSSRQGNLKMAFYFGNTRSTATRQYYAKFDLAIPNNQSLEVLK